GRNEQNVHVNRAFDNLISSSSAHSVAIRLTIVAYRLLISEPKGRSSSALNMAVSSRFRQTISSASFAQRNNPLAFFVNASTSLSLDELGRSCSFFSTRSETTRRMSW